MIKEAQNYKIFLIRLWLVFKKDKYCCRIEFSIKINDDW